jgi:hypothetical protein
MPACLSLPAAQPKREDFEFQTPEFFLFFLYFLSFFFEIDRFYLGASNPNQERGFEMSKKSCKRRKGSVVRRKGREIKIRGVGGPAGEVVSPYKRGAGYLCHGS